MEHPSPQSVIRIHEWLLDRYGPTMTHREVAESLKLKPATLRRKMWAERDLPWIRALRAAMCNHQGRDRVYRTMLVAQVIDGTYQDGAPSSERATTHQAEGA